MTRINDVLVGATMGALATATIVAFAVPPTMDPVRLSPQYYTVRLDNARVRVLEFRLSRVRRKSCTAIRKASCSR